MSLISSLTPAPLQRSMFGASAASSPGMPGNNSMMMMMHASSQPLSGATGVAAAAAAAGIGLSASANAVSGFGGHAPYASPAKLTHFRPSVLTSDVHNEAEIIFHILEHREKKCVSKLDMLTLLRGMGMCPTDGDLDLLHASMAPLIEEYEEMVREEEKRKERERKKMEDKRGGPKSTNPVKDRAEKEKKKIDDIKRQNSARGSSRGGASRPSTAATGDESNKELTEEEKKKKAESKIEPPEEIKNIDWHIFMHSVEPFFKDNRQEERELMNAFSVFDPDGLGCMTMKQLVEIATQNGESVLTPAEVKQLKEAFPGDMIEFKEFTKKLLGTWVPPPPPTAEELAERARREAEVKRKEREAALTNIDDLLAATQLEPASPGAGSAASG